MSDVPTGAGDEPPAAPPLDQELDLEARALCPDGNCVGVLGPDGRCKVCGRSASGQLDSSVNVRGIDDGGDPGAIDDPLTGSDGEPNETAGDLESRELCPDGNCVGVIGPEGRCKVCGAAATLA